MRIFKGRGLRAGLHFTLFLKPQSPRTFLFFCGNLGFGCHEISLQFAFVFTALKRASRGPLIIRGREGGRGGKLPP